MTNIITAVMLNVFVLPRTMFYVVIKNRVFEGRLCRPITFGDDDIMAFQWKKLYAMRPLQSSWYAQLVMKGEKDSGASKLGRAPKLGERTRVLSSGPIFFPNISLRDKKCSL